VAQGWSEEIGRLEEMLRAVDAWRQTNPEYGVCGARLAATVPEVVKAQVLALLEGASEAAKDGSLDGLRILVPFLSHVGELDHYLQLTEGVAEEVADRQGTQVSHSVGATIETTRAALVADQLASRVDFLCIDSDGLTASVFSSSREGTGKFLPPYKAGGIIAADPFSSLDEEGVGFLIQLAVERARSTRADVEIGVFGSYCDDPAPTRLFHGWGLDSVSCHLSYLLAARLSAAQAVIG
jgi:pyruvate,orthophosphate dikinase